MKLLDKGVRLSLLTHIESPTGTLSTGQYEDQWSREQLLHGNHNLESCQFIFATTVKETPADKVWLCDSREFALLFSLSDSTINELFPRSNRPRLRYQVVSMKSCFKFLIGLPSS